MADLWETRNSGDLQQSVGLPNFPDTDGHRQHHVTSDPPGRRSWHALSPARLVAAGLFALMAILTVVGSTSTLYELSASSSGRRFSSVTQVTVWGTSTYGSIPGYSGASTRPGLGAPLLAAAVLALLAALLLALSSSRPGPRLLQSARLTTFGSFGMLLGAFGVLVPDLLVALREESDRLVASVGPGTWLLFFAVVLGMCGAGCAVSEGSETRLTMKASPSRARAAFQVTAPTMMAVAGVIVGAASLLSIVRYDIPDTYVYSGFFSFNGWGTRHSGVPANAPLFGYAYMVVALLLVLAGASMGWAIRGRREPTLRTIVPAFSVISAAGAVGLCWAMAAYVAWGASFFAGFPDIRFSIGWGFWLLLAGACLAVLGAFLGIAGNSSTRLTSAP